MLLDKHRLGSRSWGCSSGHSFCLLERQRLLGHLQMGYQTMATFHFPGSCWAEAMSKADQLLDGLGIANQWQLFPVVNCSRGLCSSQRAYPVTISDTML